MTADPIAQGIRRGAFVFGLLKAWNRNRKVNVALRRKRKGKPLTPEQELLVAENTVEMKLPDGTVVPRTEPRIKARTSTKMLGVGAGVLAATAAAVIPNWDAINAGLMAACQSEYGPAVGLGMMAGMLGVNYFTTRFTKSPAVPGKI